MVSTGRHQLWAGTHPEPLPIAGGGLPAGMEATAAFAASRGKTKGVPTGENWMSIELRTVAGTDMRIQGGLTPAMVYTILKSV